MMKKKFTTFIFVAVSIIICIVLFTGCSKKERENTIQFNGVHQSSDGNLYVDVDNWVDFENVEMEYSIDGGTNWRYLWHGSREFFNTDKSLYTATLDSYSELQPGQQLTVGLRIAETDEYLSSRPDRKSVV